MSHDAPLLPGGSTPPGRQHVRPGTGSTPIGEYLFAFGTLALGCYVLATANLIRVPASSSSLGPKAFPYLVGGVLLVTSAIVLVGIWRGKLGQAEEGEDVDAAVSTDWVVVAKLVGFFVLHCLAIGYLGWPLAAALLFAGSAWALGAKRWWVAALTGIVLALVIQVVFGRLLGLSLPPGPLLDWIPFL
jgi:putative tricarboxylic transport membrane protein